MLPWAGLAVGALFSPFPLALAAVVLLLANVFSALQFMRRRDKLPLALLTILLPTLVWDRIAGIWGAGLWALSALPLLDDALRGYPPSLSGSPTPGRKATQTLKALVLSLSLTTALALLASSLSLALVAGLTSAYLLGLLTLIFLRVPLQPVVAEKTRARVLAGATLKCQVGLRNEGRLPMYLLLFPTAPWIRIEPREVALDGEERAIELVIRPPLAGPGRVEIPSTALDPWALTETGQVMVAMELTVVPRARVAEWLARRFLEGATGMIGRVAGLPKAGMGSRQREEYYGTRPYLPQDGLQDVDWKRTWKFRELMVKEYLGRPSPGVALIVNLEAEDPDGADALALELVGAVLTLAQVRLPAAMAAYDQGGIVATLPPADPRAMVEWSLLLLPRIATSPHKARLLGTPNVSWLRRAALGGGNGTSPTEPAVGGRHLLQLELKLLEEMALDHPATQALMKATRPIPPPASVLVLSHSQKDVNPLAVSLEKLTRKGYRILMGVEASRERKQLPIVSGARRRGSKLL